MSEGGQTLVKITKSNSTKYLSSTPQNYRDPEKQGKTEKPSKTRGDQGGMRLNATWDSGLNPGQKKRH